jgi:serine/threonine protein kinase
MPDHIQMVAFVRGFFVVYNGEHDFPDDEASIVMPSDSIAGFLKQAGCHRLLFPEQIEALISQPDLPQEGLERFCQYLLERGVLTPYQAEALRSGRHEELNIAGYPVLEQLGACPGGVAYRVLHPGLRLPLILRRLRSQGMIGDESAEEFLQRAQRWGTWQHPHLVPALEVGRIDSDIYIVRELWADHADVVSLVEEFGGPMPAAVALDVLGSLAGLLHQVHSHGEVHGGICPSYLLFGPLKEKVGPDGRRYRRPTTEATIKLAELGLLPRWSNLQEHLSEVVHLAYTPPEMFADAKATPAGDIYALGASAYFLLTGRSPFSGDSAERLMEAISTGSPKPLHRRRPDLPVELVELVKKMLQRDPAARPSAEQVVQLAQAMAGQLAEAGKSSLAGSSGAQGAPLSEPVSAAQLPVAIPVTASNGVDQTVTDWSDSWSHHMASAAAQPAAPRRARGLTDEERARSRRMFFLGGLLHLTAITLLLLWLFGAFSGSRDAEPEPSPPPKKQNPNLKPRPRLQNT